jgi:ATP-binding cassette subfamily G (WHITE) protein 1
MKGAQVEGASRNETRSLVNEQQADSGAERCANGSRQTSRKARRRRDRAAKAADRRPADGATTTTPTSAGADTRHGQEPESEPLLVPLAGEYETAGRSGAETQATTTETDPVELDQRMVPDDRPPPEGPPAPQVKSSCTQGRSQQHQDTITDEWHDQSEPLIECHQPPPPANANGCFRESPPRLTATDKRQASSTEHVWSLYRAAAVSGSPRASLLSASRRCSSTSAGLDQHHHQQLPEHKHRPTANGTRAFLMDKLARKSSSIVDCLHLRQQPSAANKQQVCWNEIGAPRAALGERTISQSMLELDESRVSSSDTFEIHWRHLTFAYQPRNWLARTCASLGSRFGLTTAANRSNLVLRDISGSFKSNQLVAVIGPSGCGKTTLLQFLAGNNDAQRDRLRISGLDEPKVAYIGQDDSLLPGLTARETLMYASRLQNSRPGFDHAQHIRPIINELGLNECAERSVSKLSGGQAKRVTIAQELLYPTNLLILDEVTSGLDASTSYSIVKLLKYLVSDQRYPMSIVMSIHQPSARLFSVFDRVYVMGEGACLYEGSCELAQINKHLAQFGLACPPYHNIADYLIELACCTPQDEDETSVSKTTTAARNDDRRDLGAPAAARDQLVEYQRKLHEQALLPLEDDDDDGGEHHPRQPASHSLCSAIERARRRRPRPFYDHFRIHFGRSLLRIRRSYILTYLQLVTYIVLGLQLATFYGADIGRLSGCPRLPANLISFVLASSGSQHANNSDDENHQQQEGAEHDDGLVLEVRRIQENMNFLLVTVMTATFAALEITVITFPLEAKTVKREWRNGWYRVSSYFFGRTLADLPFQMAFVMIFCLLIYVLTGQIGLGTWRFGVFVCTVVMTALVAQSFGFIFGALFMDNLPAAVFTAPLAVFPALLFSGFFSRVSQIPSFYRPMTYLSHFRYTFDVLLVALYGYNRCNCDQTTLSQYHAGVRNQTSTMREMFSYLFGAADCAPPTTQAPSPAEQAGELAAAASEHGSAAISHDDLTAIQASNSTLAGQLLETIVQTAGNGSTTPAPVTAAALGGGAQPAFMKPLEDALVDSLFDQMVRPHQTAAGLASNGSLTGGTGGDDDEVGADASMMDRLAARFANSLTSMLNKQSNFGHPMPRECRQFQSYLLTEFGLHDEDLLFGLLMLLVAVVLTRLACNWLLNFTIANRLK